jgi:regulator of protease activity HflC (stomatin/prohibitin superfamily)
MRLIAVLLTLGLSLLVGYYVAWLLPLLIVGIAALALWRAIGVYRALPALLALLIGLVFILGGGLSLPVKLPAQREIRDTIYEGIVSGTAPEQIIERVAQLVDSRRVPIDAVQRINRALEEMRTEVEDFGNQIEADRVATIEATLEAQGMETEEAARQAAEEAQQQAQEQASERERELKEELATRLASGLRRDISAGQVQIFVGSGLLAASIAAAASLLVGMACAEVLIVHRGGNRLAAYQMMIALLAAPLFPTGNPLSVLFASITRSFRALQIVQDGQVAYSMPSSENFRMPGPGMLVIRSGSAAVLERSGKITRIVGPGFYLTESFEHLSAIVDLSLQSKNWDLEDVLTKDSVPLRLEFTVQYRIMIDQPALITKAEYRLDEDAIRRAVLTTADWNQQTKVVAESILRDTIATRFLDEIYDPRSLRFSSGSGATPRVPLQHELRRRLGRESQRWGVEIVRVTLDKITLPQEVKQRMIEAWDVAWRDVVEVARALTEARTLTAKALGKGQAAYLEAVNEAKARLEAAGINRFVKLLEAGGEAWAEQLEAKGKALGELEAAKIGRDAAGLEAQRTILEAVADAEAQKIKGRARAMAEAERFREILLSLQGEFDVDEETMSKLIVQLAGVLTTVSDFRAFARFLLPGGRPGSFGLQEPRIIGGEEPPAD